MEVAVPFLLIMILMGGLVSSLGDSIGRKIGKKRLRFGKLRPKHTAVIGTFLAGMTGTLLTILVLSLFSAPVRSWILDGDKARVEADILRRENLLLEESMAVSKQELDQRTRLIRQREAEITQMNETLGTLNELNENLLKDQALLIAKASFEEERARKAIADINVSLDRIRSLELESNSLSGKIISSQNELLSFQSEYALIQQKNAGLVRTNTHLENEIIANKDLIDELSSSIAKGTLALASLEQSFEQTKEENRRALLDSQQQLELVRDSLQKANEDIFNRQLLLQSYETFFQSYEKHAESLRLRPLIFNINDELVRKVIPPKSSYVQVQLLLEECLLMASEAARLRGASRGPDGSHIYLIATVSNLSVTAPLDNQIDTFIRENVAAGEEAVILVRTPLNGFQGEAISVFVESKSNPVVYEAGDLILTMQVDGRKSEEQLLTDIIGYLEGNLYRQAVNDGMIPAIGHEAPIGEVTRDQVLEMVSRVRASNRPIRLQLLARDATRASDKLRVTFRLRI